MAQITKRVGKNGKVSYLIRVSAGYGVDGKQRKQSMTWTPPCLLYTSIGYLPLLPYRGSFCAIHGDICFLLLVRHRYLFLPFAHLILLYLQ